MPIRPYLLLLGLLAASAFSPRAQAQGPYADLRAGRELSQEAAVALEQRLADDPGDDCSIRRSMNRATILDTETRLGQA